MAFFVEKRDGEMGKRNRCSRWLRTGRQSMGQGKWVLALGCRFAVIHDASFAALWALSDSFNIYKHDC